MDLPATFIVGSHKEDSAALRYAIGDPVIVADGQLMNLYGRVLAIDGDQVTIMPKHEDLKVRFDKQKKHIFYFFLHMVVMQELFSHVTEESDA